MMSSNLLIQNWKPWNFEKHSFFVKLSKFSNPLIFLSSCQKATKLGQKRRSEETNFLRKFRNVLRNLEKRHSFSPEQHIPFEKRTFVRFEKSNFFDR